jgi:hypothetical protein
VVFRCRWSWWAWVRVYWETSSEMRSGWRLRRRGERYCEYKATIWGWRWKVWIDRYNVIAMRTGSSNRRTIAMVDVLVDVLVDETWSERGKIN